MRNKTPLNGFSVLLSRLIRRYTTDQVHLSTLKFNVFHCTVMRNQGTDDILPLSTTGTLKVPFHELIPILAFNSSSLLKRRGKGFVYVLLRHIRRQRSWSSCSIRSKDFVENKTKLETNNNQRVCLQVGKKLVLFACVICNRTSGPIFNWDSNRFLGPNCTIQCRSTENHSNASTSPFSTSFGVSKIGSEIGVRKYIRLHLKAILVTVHEK